MRSALLDTDMLSEVLKRKDAAVAQRAADYVAEHQRFTISTPTVMEVVEGFRRRRMDDRLDEFLRMLPSFEVLSFDASCAIEAGRVSADLLRTGQPIGRIDPMIAAAAIVNDRCLVTGNGRHYERIRLLGYALQVDDWRGAAGPASG